MTAELGVAFLVLALLVASIQAAWLLPSSTLKAYIMPALPAAALTQAFLVALAFASLMALRLDSDFSVITVAQHSNLTLPLLYKISGTWGNHEGSMLLWVMVLAAMGAVFAMSPPRAGEGIRHTALATQALIAAGVLLFILFTSNPFARQFPPPPDGGALNPLLQDIALAMHPPLLYLGYVGFSMVFSLAVAALLQGRMGREWAQIAHPWIMFAWSALTVGIGLGSWWAYRVLGWGGFWFWDPVENASLLPWLAGTALLHSNIVLKKRGQLASWVLLLAILTFGLSLLGTFLVRSGVLISVHSFASDPARGLFILLYIVFLLGGALLLYGLRSGNIHPENNERLQPLSREGMIVINNLFLLTACATVLLGTTYPMVTEWLGGERLTIGPPYYNATFLPLMVPPLLLAVIALFTPWKKNGIKAALRQALPALQAVGVAALLVLALAKTRLLMGLLGLSLAAWLGAGSLWWWIRHRHTQGALAIACAHLGAAVLAAGVTGASLWKQESERWMIPGESMELAGYNITYEQATPIHTPNYTGTQGKFWISASGMDRMLLPEYRLYDIRRTASSIPAISSNPVHDLYLVIGETSQDGGKTAVRMYYNPMIGLIWAGFMLMALGGLTATFTRVTRRVSPEL